MSVSTFEPGCVLEDPQGLEQAILERFRDDGSSSDLCGSYGSPKPPVGRTGRDGLTEVRHLDCHPNLPGVFEDEWERAPRLARDAVWLVDFDPLSLRPGGFAPVGDPWRQPPRMDPREYKANTCNVLCIRGVDAEKVNAFLDEEWEKGAVDLRKALWGEFDRRVCKVDGTPTPNAKGSGCSGQRSDVVQKLTKMALLPDVQVVMVSVRKPGMLYAYAAPGRNLTT